MRIIEARGWPLPALRADVTQATGVVIPLRPIWPGFVADGLLFAAIAAAATWVLTRPARFLIESSRARRGWCLCCGYDLRFDLARGCPECGWRREAEASAAPPATVLGERV